MVYFSSRTGSNPFSDFSIWIFFPLLSCRRPRILGITSKEGFVIENVLALLTKEKHLSFALVLYDVCQPTLSPVLVTSSFPKRRCNQDHSMYRYLPSILSLVPILYIDTLDQYSCNILRAYTFPVYSSAFNSKKGLVLICRMYYRNIGRTLFTRIFRLNEKSRRKNTKLF